MDKFIANSSGRSVDSLVATHGRAQVPAHVTWWTRNDKIPKSYLMNDCLVTSEGTRLTIGVRSMAVLGL
jgi:hypothetical protein